MPENVVTITVERGGITEKHEVSNGDTIGNLIDRGLLSKLAGKLTTLMDGQVANLDSPVAEGTCVAQIGGQGQQG